ncbi:protein of unknown function [Azospirillum baldaniorum]|uniref:Uncharacterized protein n=1 Tax=Azospirillum baldaniorum TaxID=1064539 RepID=A0A9P1JQS7_9PROT|nr:protein of unknown function [Azospirillum baldaniorum]
MRSIRCRLVGSSARRIRCAARTLPVKPAPMMAMRRFEGRADNVGAPLLWPYERGGEPVPWRRKSRSATVRCRIVQVNRYSDVSGRPERRWRIHG